MITSNTVANIDNIFHETPIGDKIKTFINKSIKILKTTRERMKINDQKLNSNNKNMTFKMMENMSVEQRGGQDPDGKPGTETTGGSTRTHDSEKKSKSNKNKNNTRNESGIKKSMSIHNEKKDPVETIEKDSSKPLEIGSGMKNMGALQNPVEMLRTTSKRWR